MELARLYPRWTAGVICSPQGATQVTHPLNVLTTLAGGLLHRPSSLTDLWGTDYPEGVQLGWTVWAYTRGVRYHLGGRAPVGSARSLWPTADWYERETREILGVTFGGHPDLRRLLTDYGFLGHPLQRDYPVAGYTEVRYSEREKRVLLRRTRFAQEFRTFDFVSPWQN